MGKKGAAIGGLIGFMLLGPIGAVLGAGVGAIPDEGSDNPKSPYTEDKTTPSQIYSASARNTGSGSNTSDKRNLVFRDSRVGTCGKNSFDSAFTSLSKYNGAIDALGELKLHKSGYLTQNQLSIPVKNFVRFGRDTAPYY